VDYAVSQDGWISRIPQTNEMILVATTYTGVGKNGINGPVFFLGYGDAIQNLVKEYNEK